MWRLANHVRQYAWGSTTEIPRLLGIEPNGNPKPNCGWVPTPVPPARSPVAARNRSDSTR